MKQKLFQVRFNLGRGENYRKWKVTRPTGEVTYYDPDKVILSMQGCVLKNHRKTAEKIFNGANKTVCAWILAEHLELYPSRIWSETVQRRVEKKGTEVSYNPRIAPHWCMDDKDCDGSKIPALITLGKQVFTYQPFQYNF